MIAGTIATLEEPASEPLESWHQNGKLPALYVDTTQSQLEGDSIAQAGTAGGRVNTPSLDVGVDIGSGKVWTDRYESPEDVTSKWVADVTGAGIVAAESVHGTGEYPFPFDLIMARTGERVERVAFELDEIAAEWERSGNLDKQWMIGSETADGVSIDYHDDAAQGDPSTANVGLGFVLSWQGTVAKGVVYASGYCAVWEDWTAATFCQFVDDELLPHSYVPVDEDEEFTQETFGNDGGVA